MMLDFNDFLGYAKHETEKEQIINQILENARNGETNFSIDLDDSFSDSELEEIRSEVERRWR